MISATFRFYAELNDFLPPERRHRAFVDTFPPHGSVKHIVESLGVPHTEVDLILVNGESVSWSAQLNDGDRVSVYPVWESVDILSVERLRPEPLRDLRFVLDMHLGRLAAYLRMLGFDVWYRKQADDDLLARVCFEESRVLLTRDVALLKRSQVTRGYWVRESLPRKQLQEAVTRFDLKQCIRPFARCLECNTPLETVAKEDVLHRLEPLTREHFHEFRRCPRCDRVYWRGSHWERMMRWIEELR